VRGSGSAATTGTTKKSAGTSRRLEEETEDGKGENPLLSTFNL
jgi:hypothetical protein